MSRSVPNILSLLTPFDGNSLLVAFQVAGLFIAVFMKYSKRSRIWVFIGLPMCVLGKGDGRTGNEASFVAAKTLVGIDPRSTRLLPKSPCKRLSQGKTLVLYLWSGGIFKSIVVGQKFAEGTPEGMAIDRSYQETQRILAIGGLAALATMLIVMLFLKDVRLDEERSDEKIENEELN
ncbi:hypothetical protein FQN55_001382 [Onygenales sp. PD_40]|nr:hypothetical protein FQN55_001382 [Onygenales sp. PD_40]KAK2779331.1 hypothetical protein FQN53_001401 [Emmonsiellopsis sp. PD_33]